MAEFALITGYTLKTVKWNRIYPGILLVFALLVTSFRGTARSIPDLDQPNIIVILTDDQGYADVGFNGCKDIPTPNIDRIAGNGVVFTNGYATYPVCGPSRAGLITGRYQDRFGFVRNPLLAPNDPGQGLPLSEETMATVLGRAGYRSSVLGKWHLGAHRSQWPLNRGFDEFFGFLSGGHQYFPELWTLENLSEIEGQWDGYKTKLMRNDGRVEESEYLTDALSREAVDFIDRHAENQPFFLYLAYNAPHTPMQSTDKYLDRFTHIQDEKRRTYAAMVSAVDDGVGLLLDKIESLGIAQETIIFFLSDNGGPEADNGSDNGPLRAGKGSLYEGGIHVPFAMQWPGKIPGGTVYEEPVLSLDIMATAVAGAGAEVVNPLDGVNLLPYLQGKEKGAPHGYLFWRKFDQQWHAVTDGDFKLLKRTGEGRELYELQQDLSEEHPLPVHENDRSPALKNAYSMWEEQMKDPVFLGLMQDREYSMAHPHRFKIPDPFQPDNTAPVVPSGYRLMWADEFDYLGVPDQTFWSFENGFVRNEELQWYQSENAEVKDGLLVIEGRREQVENPAFKRRSSSWRSNREFANYTSSSINTRDKFDFKYGIVEVRARIDTSLGSWPAIWTLGVDRRWPANGEVDIMEYYRIGGTPKILANAAWKGDNQREPVWDSEKRPFSSFLERDPRWPEKFHVWKMVWTEDVIRLYLDEELLNEIDVENATYDDGFNPFRQPHYILLNLALGANGGDPSGSSFPISYEVDYVRVYQPVQQKPNVVIIYLDDLGYGDPGCYGTGKIATPNVDDLAENGIRFTNAYSSAATCTPSRYSLLTGEYAFRIKAGIQDGDAPLLIGEGTPTLPGMLKQNGYKTAMIGKWHLGLGDGDLDWNGKIAPGPLERGFDYAWMIPATGDRVPTVWVENHHVAGLDPEDPIEVSYKEKVGDDPTGLENPELLRIPADHQHAKTIVNGVSRIGWMSGGNSARWNDEQIPHLMLKKAREFISENREEPFFIYFSMHDVHDPRLPDYRFQGQSGLGNYGDVIVQMDWVTGQLVDYLEKVGLSENTLIIFTSDNGPALNDGYEDHRSITDPENGDHQSAGPFRGGKYSAFEAGSRMPTIAYWPTVIQPGISDALISQVDLYASIAAITGHSLQPDEAPDSQDVSGALLGESQTGREYLVTESFTYSVRKGDYKYIHPVKNLQSAGWISEVKKIESGASTSPQLYDLAVDIGEQNNIAAENESVLKEMRAYLEGVLRED